MKLLIKSFMRFLILTPYFISSKWASFLSFFHWYFRDIHLDWRSNDLENLKLDVIHHSNSAGKVNLSFYTPNALCLFRANTFSTKEPETLEWIEEFGVNSATLFDIGANVGLYSIYHAVINKGKVAAFEPSFFNLKQLTKNINLNSCQDRINIISTPLSSKNGIHNFIYGSSVEGGALSAFGVDFGYDGDKLNVDLSAKVLGMSLDFMKENGFIDSIPNLVKIDVDGIEHIILSGARDTLTHKDCKSVLVEVNDDFSEQSFEVDKLLTEYGFILRDKKHGDFLEKSEKFSSTYNQIWVKP